MLFNLWRRRRNPQDPSSRGRAGRRRRPHGLRQPPTLERLESRLAPATHTWTGASTLSANWSDAANWSGGAPAAGESNLVLIFPNAAQTANTNDIAGLTVASLQFTASGYAIRGDALTLQGDTTVTADNTDNGTNTLGLPLDMEPVFGGTQAFFDHVYHVAAGATLQVTGQMTGAPVLNFVDKTGAGTLVLAGAGNNFGGSTEIDSGTLAQGVADATPPSPCIVAQEAVFDLAGFDATLGSLAGAGTVSTASGSVFSTLTTGLDNTSTSFTGLITGNLNLVKAGTGTFTLGAVNAYTGTTTIQAGTLAQGVANATPPSPCIVAQEAVFDLAGFDATLGSLAGAGSVLVGLDPPTLTTGGDNTSTTFSGTIGGPGDLTKVGTGTFTLSGTNTYTGQTSVLGGTLQVTGTLSPSTAVTVAAGASLTGTATIANATVNGTSGNDTFTIDTTGVTLDGTVIVSSPYTTLTVNGMGGNDTFDVLGTNAGTTTILNAVSGVNRFNIGSAANTLDPIQGVVTVQGQGADILNIYDQGTSSLQAYGLSSTQFTRTPSNPPNPLGSPTQSINYFNIAQVNVYGGSGADLWGAFSTLAGTTSALYSGGGSINDPNEFIVENQADVLDAIQGPLALHGGGVYDFATASDTLNTVGHNYTLTTGMLQRDGMANITYDGLGEFIVAAANNPNFGHTPNTVNVQSLGNVFVPIAVGTGDTVTVGQNGSMASILGDVRIQSVVGQPLKQVILDDSADSNARTITLGSDPAFGYLVNGLANGSQGRGRIGLMFDPTTPVSIRTGAGNDDFRIHDLAGVPALALDAGGGTNTLDYSAYQGAVQVILPLGMATGFASGIQNIQNVTGGQGNNLLVGDANPNVLIGGTGRNVLIGGAGGDTLDASGSSGDDILIGGSTDYDTNLADLDAIFAEWTRTDLGFRDRFSDLTSGTNGRGATPLNQVNGQLIGLLPTTVHADTSPDTLIGSNQTDPATGQRVHNWFFYDFDDVLANFLNSSDHKTKLG